MADETQLLLQVVRAPEGSALTAGATFPVVGPSAVVGRSPTADVVVADRTVSREHVRIEVGPPPRVIALTTSNGTFVDQQPATPDAPVVVSGEGVRLQLGGVLLSLTPLAETEPVLEPVRTRRPSSPEQPALSVTWDAGQCVVRCGARDLGLTGAGARMLGLLATRAGEVVHHWDLQEELGTPHLAPLATAVRHALGSAVEAGVLDEALLRERLASAGIAEADDTDRDALMRKVVQARRGHGYILHLRPDDVGVDRV